MAPPRLYELPHEQLVRLLAQSRREGLSFDQAWVRAMRPGRRMVLTNTREAPLDCVRWPTDSTERIAWQGALKGVRDVFRRAYQGRRMTVREESAANLALVLSAADRVAAARGIDDASGVRSAA